MMFLIGFNRTTTPRRKISTRRRQNWKKLSTPSFKSSTNNMVDKEEWMMMILMMMTFQTTTNCKLVPSKRGVHILIPLPNPRQQAHRKRHNNLSTRHLSNYRLKTTYYVPTG